MKIVIAIIILNIFSVTNIMAQKESSDVRRGNKQYNKENYVEAEIDYRRGLEKNNKGFEAHFNLGDALFKQEKYPEAIDEYKAAEACLKTKGELTSKSDKERQAAIDHNIGNAQFAQQQFSDAVESYKRALKNNPKDNDTRYNLVKAMQMLQQQQQNQEQNQEQNKEQQQQQNQEQQQQEQNQEQQEQDQQQQQDPNQMDKETAEQLLQALEQDEKDTQEKVKRQESQGGRAVEKNW